MRLALVSVPVQLVSAVKTGARIAFHQVDAASAITLRDAATAIAAGEAKGWADYSKIKQSLKPAALRALEVAF